MSVRPTQAAVFSRVQTQLASGFGALIRYQEQIASGKRLVRPSDDPGASAQSHALRTQLASRGRYTGSIQSGRLKLDSAAAALQEAHTLASEARALLLQGMSGTFNAEDRQTLAMELELLRTQLLDIANRRSGDDALFAGTANRGQAFESVAGSGPTHARYLGDAHAQQLLVGLGLQLDIGIPGSEVFARAQRTGTTYGGLTGAAAGSSADDGVGYDVLVLRHDATSASLPGGAALAQGGALDTLLGTHTLTLDSVAGTAQLDNGPVVALPQPGSPSAADFVVRDEGGAQLHLDLSAWNGSGFAASVSGAGSASIDGTQWVALDFLASDLELIDGATGAVTHLDTRSIRRAGQETVFYGGTVNIFDALQGAADSLRNADGLSVPQLVQRLETWLSELDRNADNILASAGTLGITSKRMESFESHYADSDLATRGRLSALEDVDVASAVLEMSRAEQTLQLTQATSARLLGATLLQFLR